jgi:hypothetical protein
MIDDLKRDLSGDGDLALRWMVEPNGIEPMTSSMPWKRSPS